VHIPRAVNQRTPTLKRCRDQPHVENQPQLSLRDLHAPIDDDGDYSDETTLLNSGAVDDTWSAGYVGLYRAAGGSSIQQYDDLKIGYDNNSDDDIADDGDDIQIDDSFGSNVLSLSYDTEGDQGGSPKGNLTLDTAVAASRHRSLCDRRATPGPLCQGLTDDGVYKYEYDAWNPCTRGGPRGGPTRFASSGLRPTPRVKGNRLVKAKRRVDAETVVATYAYLPLTRHTPRGGGRRAATCGLHPPWRVKGLGDNRRAKKVVQNCGTEHLAGDGGNTTVHFYYCGTGFQPVNWNICETRNGSNQATAQYVWGTQYTDEVVFVDINGSPVSDNDCNPDQGIEAQTDSHYFYHQDRNWNVVALSEYDTGDTNNGRIVERYSYTPYGQFVVLTGDSGSGELGNLTPTSTVGSVFAHQGLPMDHEKGSYQNRFREYAPELHRFAQQDPSINGRAAHLSIPVSLGADVYEYCGSAPMVWTDSLGLCHCCPPNYCVPDNPPPPPVCNKSTWRDTMVISGECKCNYPQGCVCVQWWQCKWHYLWGYYWNCELAPE